MALRDEMTSLREELYGVIAVLDGLSSVQSEPAIIITAAREPWPRSRDRVGNAVGSRLIEDRRFRGFRSA